MIVLFLIFLSGLSESGGIYSQAKPPTLSLPPQPTRLEENPEGYYSFLQAPNANPPQVRPPPYFKSSMPCAGVSQEYTLGKTLKNLCGDLNRGYIPANPMKQNVLGAPYPFELLKNKTLEYFSRTLPILQGDETIPKVTKFHPKEQSVHQVSTSPSPSLNRVKREESNNIQETFHMLKDLIMGSNVLLNFTKRNARKFCENGGMLCMLYKAIQGEPLGSGLMERREDVIPELRRVDQPQDGPPTPCPAKVEYATPVFARNYQGVWRYVVQIPYEGYFTQTVEITKCIGDKCHYLDGKCLSSPRWVSLLVAEIYYPEEEMLNTTNPSNPLRNPLQGEPTVNKFQSFQKRSVQVQNSSHCDGHDEKGCFQVRLYYDWFLVPGSCKCWKQNYLHKFLH